MSDELEMEITAGKDDKKLKAKPASLVGQIFAAVWLAGWSATKFLEGGVQGVEITDFLLSGIGIVACFSPVYFSILLDKIKAIKFGD